MILLSRLSIGLKVLLKLESPVSYGGGAGGDGGGPLNYPVWDVPHLGRGFYWAMGERQAARLKDPGSAEYLRRHTRFSIVVSLVFGALTGVGIWWIIGLVSPRAMSVLIRTFVWGWAIEWCCFLAEVAAILFCGARFIVPRWHRTGTFSGQVIRVQYQLRPVQRRERAEGRMEPGQACPGALYKRFSLC